jgi:hypothetical protein
VAAEQVDISEIVEKGRVGVLVDVLASHEEMFDEMADRAILPGGRPRLPRAHSSSPDPDVPVSPTLVVNGSNDVVIATVNSFILQQHIPDAKLVLYPDSNHGAHYQFHEDFITQLKLFLDQQIVEAPDTSAFEASTAATSWRHRFRACARRRRRRTSCGIIASRTPAIVSSSPWRSHVSNGPDRDDAVGDEIGCTPATR